MGGIIEPSFLNKEGLVVTLRRGTFTHMHPQQSRYEFIV